MRRVYHRAVVGIVATQRSNKSDDLENFAGKSLRSRPRAGCSAICIGIRTVNREGWRETAVARARGRSLQPECAHATTRPGGQAKHITHDNHLT